MAWILGIAILPLIAIALLFIKGEGRISGKELLVLIGQCVILSGLGVWSGLQYKTTSTEVWNGRVARKWETTGHCCHCRQVTDNKTCTDSQGRQYDCSTSHEECDHSFGDDEWYAESTNGETVFADTCNPPGGDPPERWTAIRLGEPTAVEHRYTNYIRANPDSILRTRGVAARFAGRLPAYPRVYDEYRMAHVVNMGVPLAPGQLETLEARIDAANADLGASHQVNVTVVLTSESDRAYADAIREAWITGGHGAEKNDFTVVIGLPDSPRVGWVEFVTWTRQERVKSNVRDRLERLEAFDGARAAHIIRNEVDNGFVRRPMADYEYLYATVSPPWWILILTWIVEILVTGFLGRWFWDEDPFDRGFSYGRRPSAYIGRRRF